jgi:23S rRNA (cytidine1920-2'-O)/16S rRNA (cytidine1409-2'-O)-methyltransferase
MVITNVHLFRKRKIVALVNLQRLDQILVDLQMVSSRTRAEVVIKNDGVLVNGVECRKPGKRFDPKSTFQLLAEPMPWVSRGALKLLSAFEQWPIDLDGAVCLDVGASTGGFTEVMLSLGAKKIVAVDTGTDQLHPRVAEDSRVENLAQTDIRTISAQLLGGRVDFVAVDLSFISLSKVLEPLSHLIQPERSLIILFKPQFEVGPEHVGKGGIVRDISRVNEVKSATISYAQQVGFKFIGEMTCPLKGGDGNQEYLFHFIYSPQA